MKHTYLFSALFFLYFSHALSAQDQRTLQTKVADILNQIPARDVNHRNQLAESMLSLGTEGIALFTDKVVPDGSADDTRVRTALNGLALYAGQPGKEEARLLVSKAFLSALDKSSQPLVKAFFLYHLPFIGKSEIVRPVSAYLQDAALADDAVQALVAIQDPAASAALIAAFPTASDPLKATILQGVASYAPVSAAGTFQAQAGSPNAAIRKQALRGLARIGQPDAQKTLWNAAKQAGFGFEPSEATRSLLLYLDQLAQHQHLAACKSLGLQIIKATAQTASYSSALAALDILVEQFGMDAFDQVLIALDHPRADYRAGALQSAAMVSDIAATRRLLEKAATASPAVKAQIIRHLGKTMQVLAVDLAMRSISASEPDVRAASLEALSTLKGHDALPALLESARNTRSAADKKLLGELINKTAGTADAPALLAALAVANEAGKALLIDVLAARHAADAFQPIRSYCSASDPQVADAAYAALAAVARPGDMPSLLMQLEKADTETHIQAVQQALVATATPDVSPLLLDAWKKSPSLRIRLLGAFPQIGGDALLALVQDALSQKDLKDAAFKALSQWKEVGAAPALFQMVAAEQQSLRAEAARAYLRIISQSGLPADQKVLKLSMLLEQVSKDMALQREAISHLGRIRTFPAFLAVAPYLEQSALQSDAAWAISRIALPGSDGKSGLYGDAVRPVLERSIAVISGPESEYAKENIRTWLRQMPKEAGFVSMFNGKDLSGWQGLVGNPISRAAMAPENLAKAQQEADAKLPQNWTVRDGLIRFTGSGFENLCSVKSYKDFEMLVDWRIRKGGDSGIYLRGTPQVQIWDTSLVAVGAQVGSGGLYNNQVNPSKPLKVADNPIGEWNTFFIRMLGEKVTVYLNGELVADNVTLENYWDRKLPIFPEGPIELQAHGTDLAFRNIYVREIKPDAFQLTHEEIAEGYVALFNGKDLSGWIGNKVDYKANNQTILIDPSSGGTGNLYTEKEYGNFSFRFEFQLTPGANNGIGIRAPLEGDAAYVGMEIQVLDNTSPIYANLQTYQYHGSVYGVIPAKREFLRPVGEWNEEEIRIEGSRIRVTLNGTVIVDGDILEASQNGTIDHKEHPGLQRSKGHIGFLGHGSEVRFRNIRIKEL